MAPPFDRDKSVIFRNISNLIGDKELEQSSVVAVPATTAADMKAHRVERLIWT
ncbi:MAG: hypothetical protein U0575_15340 [Phycisphaerales bacterium]